MPRPGDALVCPSCGTRNKAKWDFCVRCGESLAEAQAAVPARAPAADEAIEDASSGWNGILAAASLVAFLVVAAVAVRYSWREGPAPLPGPAAFTYPTQPPKPRHAPVANQRAGAEAYAEGLRLMQAGDPAGAVAQLGQAVAQEPENGLYQRAYGEALLRSGDKDAGLAALGEAARLQPHPYRTEYARYLAAAGRSTEAASEIDAVLAERPNDLETLTWAGRLYVQNKDFARAAELLKRASQVRPQDTELLGALALAHEGTGDWNEAALAYGNVVLLQPDNHAARGRLAAALVKQGKIDQAIATYRRGMERDPRAAVLYRGLGSVLEDAGRPTEAAAAYREYARLAPAAPDAKGLVVRAERLSAGTGS